MVNKDALAAAVKQTTCLISANASVGTELLGAHGDTLGTVVDFVLDTDTGAVAYVMVASGGFMGIGEDRYALPWSCAKPLQGADGLRWRCAAAQLPLQYRIDSAAPQSPWSGAGKMAE